MLDTRIQPEFAHLFADSAQTASPASPSRRQAGTSEEEIARLFDDARPGRDGDPAVAYILVERAAVDPAVVDAVRAGVTLASLDLGIEAPMVAWFAPEDETAGRHRRRYGADWPSFSHCGMRGIAIPRRGLIGMCADLSPADAAETAAHECRHLTQANPCDDEREAEAVAYGLKARELLVSVRQGRETVGDVHVWNGCPARSSALAGVARPGDLIFGRTFDGGHGVFANWGSKARPDWTRRADLPLSSGVAA